MAAFHALREGGAAARTQPRRFGDQPSRASRLYTTIHLGERHTRSANFPKFEASLVAVMRSTRCRVGVDSGSARQRPPGREKSAATARSPHSRVHHTFKSSGPRKFGLPGIILLAIVTHSALRRLQETGMMTSDATIRMSDARKEETR
jgi:hypothetical protein